MNVTRPPAKTRTNHINTLLPGEPISSLVDGHNTFTLYIRVNNISQLVNTPFTTYCLINGNDCTGDIEIKIYGEGIIKLRDTLSVEWIYKVTGAGYVTKGSDEDGEKSDDLVHCKLNAQTKNIAITEVAKMDMATLIFSTL